MTGKHDIADPCQRSKRLSPRKIPSQERSKALVDAIVEAGRRVLEERGWDRFAMQTVADVAGVSPGSLYQYFPNKHALVAEIIERESARELAHYLDAFSSVPTDASIPDVLDAFVRAVLVYRRHRGELLEQALAAMPDLGYLPALRRSTEQAVEFLQLQLMTKASPSPHPNPKLAAFVLANSIHSLTHQGILPRPDGVDDETLALEISRLVRGYLGT